MIFDFNLRWSPFKRFGVIGKFISFFGEKTSYFLQSHYNIQINFKMKINSPYLIAEIGQAHDGSLGIAHSYIEALSDTGINAVKFQMHIAESESSIHEDFRINFSYEDKSRYDYWKRMEFSLEQWIGIKKHCEEKNLDLIVSPFSINALEIVNKLECRTLKLGSGETNNHLLIKELVN